MKLEDLMEKLKMRKERKEKAEKAIKEGKKFLRPQRAKEYVKSIRVKATPPREISELKKRIFKTKRIKPEGIKSGSKTDAEKLLDLKQKEFMRIQKERASKFEHKQKMFQRQKERSMKRSAKLKYEKKLFAMQQRQQSQSEANQMAMQQRATYEAPAESFPEEQKQQEQFGEDVSGKERGKGMFGKFGGGFQEAWRKWQVSQKNKPIPTGSLMSPQQNMLTPQKSMMSPQGSPLVRAPGNILHSGPVNLLTPIKGPNTRPQINHRIKVW